METIKLEGEVLEEALSLWKNLEETIGDIKSLSQAFEDLKAKSAYQKSLFWAYIRERYPQTASPQSNNWRVEATGTDLNLVEIPMPENPIEQILKDIFG